MPQELQLSVIISTYQRPQHLRRCLQSLALQQLVDGQFEVIVTDDGSQDETADVIAQFSRHIKFPVRFTTHEHNGFQLAKCRNDGVRLAEAPYILFTDGDCIFPPDHLRKHLQAAKRGVVQAGDCIRLDRETSELIDESVIATGSFVGLCPRREKKKIRAAHRKAALYAALIHPLKPKLVGNNIGIWKSQLELVNGFDEKFRGWGCEDDDLRDRLRAHRVRVASVMGKTYGYHLWHPPHQTTPTKWSDGANVGYLHRRARLSRCLYGLRQRRLADLAVKIQHAESTAPLARMIREVLPNERSPAEVELVVGSSTRSSRSEAECRFRVLAKDERTAPADELDNRVDGELAVDPADLRNTLLTRLEEKLLGGRASSSRGSADADGRQFSLRAA